VRTSLIFILQLYGVWQITESLLSYSVACGRQRRRMLHPRSEPQIFATLDALCGVVRAAAHCLPSRLLCFSSADFELALAGI